MSVAQQRLVRITLDVTCYDDLDLEDIDWRDKLGLEGNESVHVNIRDYDDPF
jgi:hypothetical protein